MIGLSKKQQRYCFGLTDQKGGLYDFLLGKISAFSCQLFTQLKGQVVAWVALLKLVRRVLIYIIFFEMFDKLPIERILAKLISDYLIIQLFNLVSAIEVDQSLMMIGIGFAELFSDIF